jgi:NADH:ubiquinone oxidoreductase subunit 5 (subunit L)/multisubunit Na+/H+ antiporter MnhA subunit
MLVKKAFVTNRVGDCGLLLGILGLYWITGSFEFQKTYNNKIIEVSFKKEKKKRVKNQNQISQRVFVHY